eukprot:1773945-Amphidinium_carterae.1
MSRDAHRDMGRVSFRYARDRSRQEPRKQRSEARCEDGAVATGKLCPGIKMLREVQHTWPTWPISSLCSFFCALLALRSSPYARLLLSRLGLPALQLSIRTQIRCVD